MLNTVLDDLATVIGYTATRKIALLFAGRRLCVPRQAGGAHALVGLLGESVFRALVREFGGEEIFVPAASADDRLRRDIAIAGRLAAGEPFSAIAAALGLSYNRVRQIAQHLEAETWAVYAAGHRSTASQHLPLPPCDRCGAKNLGTGGVSAEPPPPCAVAAAA